MVRSLDVGMIPGARLALRPNTIVYSSFDAQQIRAAAVVLNTSTETS